MPIEEFFSIANALALSGWIALALAPAAPRITDLWAGWLVPGALALAYSVGMLMHFADAPGGFGSLAEVQALFTDADVALAGWVHYLAFDLFIGAWIVRDARSTGLSHWAVLPILPFVFLFGPAGLLGYLGVRLLRQLPTLSRSGAVA